MMPFIPIGFWSRLLTRLIVFAESKFIEVSIGFLCIVGPFVTCLAHFLSFAWVHAVVCIFVCVRVRMRVCVGSNEKEVE